MNDTKVSKEFADFMEAQDAIRAWVRENKDQPLPQFLKDRLTETQRAYEQTIRNDKRTA